MLVFSVSVLTFAWSTDPIIERMITHAYVRYQYDRRCAVVKIEDIRGFKADDFRTFYNVKWTGKDGEAHFYRGGKLALTTKLDATFYLCVCVRVCGTCVRCQSTGLHHVADMFLNCLTA